LVKALCVSALLVAVVAASTESEFESDVALPRHRRNGNSTKLVSPTVLKPRTFLPKRDVIIVPKGDPRARGPNPFHQSHHHHHQHAHAHQSAQPQSPVPHPILRSSAPGVTCTGLKGRCIARTACGSPNSVHTGLCPGATYCCVPPVSSAAAVIAAPVAPVINTNGMGAKLAATALSVCANYHASGATYSQPRRQFGLNVKFSDCSSFVETVFEQAGYPTFWGGRGGAQTAAMRSVIAKKGGGYHKNAQLGDVVMWASGSSGHVGIITKVCSPTTFQLVAMGNHGCGPQVCMTWQKMTAWGEGGMAGFQGYWTAH